MKQSKYEKNEEKSLRAWLLPFAKEKFIALSLHSCQEIIESPQVLSLPVISPFGIGVIRWRNQWIPLIDFNSFVTGDSPVHNKENRCLIVAFKTENGIQYGAFSLLYYPNVVSITDSNICAMPETAFDWSRIAISCVYYHKMRVPIVDSRMLFLDYY